MKERKNKMKDSQWHSPDQLFQWFNSPQGSQFIQAEYALLDKSLGRLFGSHCAISSVYTSERLIQRIPCRRVYDLISPSLQLHDRTKTEAKKIVAPVGCLPFPDDSLDGFVLLHTFDFVDNPHDAIREVARVIRPGGQMIVIGFNPASVLGWSRYMPGLRGQSPLQARFLGRQRLCDWLHLLNFDVEYFGGSTLVPFRDSRPSTQSKNQLSQGSVWKAARIGLGKAFRERYGSVYCLRVRKSHLAGTLVGLVKPALRPMWQPMAINTAVSRQNGDCAQHLPGAKPQKQPSCSTQPTTCQASVPGSPPATDC